MFCKNKIETQMDSFYSPSNHLGKRAFKKYDYSKTWQSIFYTEVTGRIGEVIFSVLFDNANGAQNASECRLVAGMLFKFNLLARKTLGLNGFEDDSSCAALYYNFHAALVKYQDDNEMDLVEKCLEQITGSQAKT